MAKIQRALISVSGQGRACALCSNSGGGWGGNPQHRRHTRVMREAGLEVKDVSDYTGFPEMMDGRVKTLHPKVHGGLLHLRGNAEHEAACAEHGIQPIDLVVVNLYPFEETVAKPDVTLEDAIENIDIGGPSMLRSAAKNHERNGDYGSGRLRGGGRADRSRR